MTRQYLRAREAGFTLIELMVALVIALVIMAGLFVNFSAQNTEYNYQNRRIDVVQDMEFTIKHVADDLRAALISVTGAPTGNPVENAAFAGTAPTTRLDFWVWDETSGVVNDRAQRAYALVGDSLRYDREASVVDNTGSADSEILDGVTFFKIFRDDTDIGSRAAFADIPPPMASLTLNDPDGIPFVVPGYTILIEVAVPAGYKQGVMRDVRGNSTANAPNNKRVWRYMQIYPMTVVN